MRYIILYILLLQQGFGFDYQLQSTKINDHIECFFGLEEKIYASNGANIINSCFIETTEGYIVIESGPTYSYAQQFYEILQKCISRLNELQRIAFVMKHLDDEDTGDICKELNITTSNYWVIIHRAKLQLRKCLELNWIEN